MIMFLMDLPDSTPRPLSGDFSIEADEAETPADPRQAAAADNLVRLFEAQRARVFFSRQLEVMFEGDWFHWVTSRATRELVASGMIVREARPLTTGGMLHLMWHRSYRYYKRDAAKLVRLVEEYADPNIGGALGLQAEHLILEGFARRQFVLQGRHTRSFGAEVWTETAHELDFIFERDGVAYGVEVKNMLGYMDHGELSRRSPAVQTLGSVAAKTAHRGAEAAKWSGRRPR